MGSVVLCVVFPFLLDVVDRAALSKLQVGRQRKGKRASLLPRAQSPAEGREKGQRKAVIGAYHNFSEGRGILPANLAVTILATWVFQYYSAAREDP